MLRTDAMLLILVSAAVTFFLRAVPFLVFRGDKELPAWLKRLNGALPAAIMAVLVVYCLKEFPGDPIRTGIPQAIAVLCVAVSYIWKHNTMVSILLGTIVYMCLI